MSDDNSRLGKPVYDDKAFEPKPPNRSLYLVVGVISAIVAAAGLMFFSSRTPERNDIARTPDTAGIGAPTGEPPTPTVPRITPGITPGITPIPATPAPETAPAAAPQ
jgi:hypothetical protein